MPRPHLSLGWLFAAGLALSACRPGDAPKEPIDPNEPSDPQVSREAAPRAGGIALSVARRGQVVAKL